MVRYLTANGQKNFKLTRYPPLPHRAWSCVVHSIGWQVSGIGDMALTVHSNRESGLSGHALGLPRDRQ